MQIANASFMLCFWLSGNDQCATLKGPALATMFLAKIILRSFESFAAF